MLVPTPTARMAAASWHVHHTATQCDHAEIDEQPKFDMFTTPVKILSFLSTVVSEFFDSISFMQRCIRLDVNSCSC